MKTHVQHDLLHDMVDKKRFIRLLSNKNISFFGFFA
jgi:hypothetical protein